MTLPHTDPASNPFIAWVEHKIMPPLVRLAGKPVVVAVQDGVMSAIPAIVVGFLLYFLFPPERYVFKLSLEQMGPLSGVLFGAKVARDPKTELLSRALEAFNAGLGCMSLWASFRIAWKLARLQDRVGWLSGCISLMAFSLTFPLAPLDLHDLFLYLAHGGLFVAILLAWLLAVLEVRCTRRVAGRPKTTRLQSIALGSVMAFVGVGAGVVSLNYALFRLSGLWNLAEPLQINTLVYKIFAPLMEAGDSPLVVLVILSMILLTTMGVHGTGVVGSIVLPIWFALLADNARAARDMLPIPHIVTPSFMHWCFMGGSGCTLPLCLMMLRARSRKLRKIARISILPSLCNINETLTFGIPLIMNPLTVIPFVSCPVLLASLHYLELSMGWWHRTIVYLPFVIPTPITMWLASGGDWRAFPLFAVDFVLCFAIWYPFFGALDARYCDQESEISDSPTTEEPV